jgi:hypothetical protein
VSEPPASSGPPEPPSLQRLDPDRAGDPASAAAPPPASAPPASPAAPAAPVLDTRRYRWMIGIFGLCLVVGISVYQFATHGVGTTGVPAGQRLHLFSAPLANTDLDGIPNPRPPCTLAGHDPRILNVCLLVKRAPLVLAFFVTGAGDCIRQVEALQTLSERYPAAQFAAVAIDGSHAGTARLVRSHRWTIPVAYDSDGRVGALYSVAACPMVELANRGGVVADRLIGDRWRSVQALAPKVRALVR